MAGVVDLRGSGLARAHRALAELEEHPERLDDERRRFSESPPPYKSDMSGTTTRSQSPNPPTHEQRLRRERRMQLAEERVASKPGKQFSAQVKEERQRMWTADPRTNWRDMALEDLYTFQDEARETVKKRWVEQGIWNDKWTYFTIGLWKHEEPVELESESETDTDAEYSQPLFALPRPKPRRPKSDEEKRRIAERRVVRERERQASRPYHQFVYQVSEERERMQKECSNGEGAVDDDMINTRAYEIVKNTWIRRGIWKARWGILPGMVWKHEQPFDEESADGVIQASETALRDVQPPVNHVAADERPFAPPFGSLFRPVPLVEPGHREASAVMTVSRQGPAAGVDSTGLDDGDAEHPSSAPNPPRPRMGRRALRPTNGQAPRPTRRRQPRKDEQASAPLGPVHAAKVSKPARKSNPGRQQRPRKVASDDLLLSAGVDAAAAPRQPSPPPDGTTPRRSKRIRQTVSTNITDPARTNTHKRETRPKPKEKDASSPAKPRGIAKKQTVKPTRGRPKRK